MIIGNPQQPLFLVDYVGPMTTRLQPQPQPRRSAIAALNHNAGELVVNWSDGRQSRFAAIWLLDNRPDGRHGPLGQRLFDIAELPEEPRISSAALTESGDVAVTLAPVNAALVFSATWLREHALDPASRAERRRAPQLWDKSLAQRLPTASYRDVSTNERALTGWLADVRDYGFSLLTDVPTEPGTVLQVISLFGYVRETNYGKLFDVVSVEQPTNLAFTGLALGNHTDNPYRDPVPQLQLLHCLAQASEGGESVVVDGFNAAERLRRESPADFALLTRHAVPFRYVEDGDGKRQVDLQAKSPLIELDSDGGLYAVRYNNRSAAPLDLPEELMIPYYRAYRRFGRLLHDPQATAGFRLRPGDLFIVDNRRVLHGRRGFGSGRRHLQGAYADKDSLLSKLRALEARP
jgi:gamma-butyrobetaine dioxygenase